MRILLAEDDQNLLKLLRMAVSGIPGAELAACAGNERETRRLVSQIRPEIAVIDVDMPGLEGLALVADLMSVHPPLEVILVAASERSAVRAFELHVVDYLLKPLAFERFRESIKRAKRRIEMRKIESRMDRLQSQVASSMGIVAGSGGYEQSLWPRTHSGLVRIDVDRIEFIRSYGDYVNLHVPERSYLLRETLTSLEGRLNPAHFMRIHRSVIVQRSHVRSLSRRGTRSIYITVAAGVSLKVGTRYMESVVTELNARRWRDSAAGAISSSRSNHSSLPDLEGGAALMP